MEKQETEEVTVTEDGSEYHDDNEITDEIDDMDDGIGSQEDVDLNEGTDIALRIIDYIGNDYVAIEKRK